MGEPRVKLHDVARASGVSAQTVSRVVRNAPGVAKGTRERVLECIAALGYRPNLAARSLSASRIGSVHVIVAARLHHGTMLSFIAICEALAEMDLSTSTSVLRGKESIFDAVPVSADAIIVLGGQEQPLEWLESVSSRIPVILVGNSAQPPEMVSTVMVDQGRGAELAVQHLVDRGCRHLAHIAGPNGWVDARLRREAFQQAAQRNGVDWLVVESKSWEARDGHRLGATIPPEVDGLFAGNDQLALGYLNYASVHQIRIPKEVAVVGFDDVAGAESFLPPLTTIQQDFVDLGHLAVQRVKERLAGAEPTHDFLTPTLVVRESA